MMSETIQLPLNTRQQETVYQDRNQTIQRVIAHFKGFNKEYFVSDHGQRAAVMVVKNKKILLVKQYRLLINGISYEIPGGRIEPGEMPEAAAVRECMEETGVRCLNTKPVFDYMPGLDILKNHTYIFYTADVEETNDKADRRVWEPLANFKNKILKREIVDPMTMLAFFTYSLWISGGKL
jgi:ADP-ribose pyrophosphatase